MKIDLNPIRFLIRFCYGAVDWVERNTPGEFNRDDTLASVLIGLAVGAIVGLILLANWLAGDPTVTLWHAVLAPPILWTLWALVTVAFVYVRRLIRTRKEWL